MLLERWAPSAPAAVAACRIAGEPGRGPVQLVVADGRRVVSERVHHRQLGRRVGRDDLEQRAHHEVTRVQQQHLPARGRRRCSRRADRRGEPRHPAGRLIVAGGRRRVVGLGRFAHEVRVEVVRVEDGQLLRRRGGSCTAVATAPTGDQRGPLPTSKKRPKKHPTNESVLLDRCLPWRPPAETAPATDGMNVTPTKRAQETSARRDDLPMRARWQDRARIRRLVTWPGNGMVVTVIQRRKPVAGEDR